MNQTAFILPETTALQFASRVTFLVLVMANSTQVYPLCFLCMISPSQLKCTAFANVYNFTSNYVLGFGFFYLLSLFSWEVVEGLHGFASLSEVIILVVGRELQIFRFMVLHPANIKIGRACCTFPISLVYLDRYKH